MVMDTTFPAQREELAAIWTELQRQWEHTKSVWNDHQRYEFEHHVWLPLSRDITELLNELEEAGALVKKAQRELPTPPGRWGS